MKINLFTRLPDPPALEQWRRALLNLFLRISLALALPIVLVSMVNDLRFGRALVAFFALVGYLTMAAAALLPAFSVQTRAQVMILISYLVGSALIVQNGIVGAGILLLLMTIMLATLLLPWQQATLVAVLISLTVMAVYGAIGVRWLQIAPDLAGRLSEPALLVVNALFIVYIIWFLLTVLASLISRLSESLQATEASNAELERRVLERTARLDEAQRHLQLILRTIPEQFWLKDQGGRYLLVSDALASYYNYRPEEMVGRAAAELFDPDLIRFIANGDQLVFAGQSIYTEHTFGRDDGPAAWFESTNTPVYDEAGTLVGLVGLARNITMRKEAELALARQLRYAEALAQCSRILLTRSTTSDAYTQTLDEALKVLRVATESDRIAVYTYPNWDQRPTRETVQVRLIGAVSAPHVPPQSPVTADLLRDFPEDLCDLLAQGKTMNGPVADCVPLDTAFRRYLAESQISSVAMQPIIVGGHLWGHMSASDYSRDRTWDDGAAQLLRTAAEMIVTFTQGWEAGQALASSEASLRALRDALPDLLFVVDNDATIIHYHAPLVDQFYVPPKVFLGRRVTEVLPEPTAQRLAAAISETRRSGKMQILEYDLPAAGQPGIYESRLVPIDPAHILCVVRDITEARQATNAMLHAKEAAEAADRAKSAFLATMSHEIRTPLNAVLGMAGLLRDSPLSPEQRSYVETIRTGGETLLAVITHILDFSHIESGRLELEAQPFNLGACFGDACDLVSYEADRKGLSFIIDLAPDLPRTVVGDVVRLRQVLINLLANAVKFTARGMVTLKATAQPSPSGVYAVTISVHDTGIGIAPTQIAQIFEPFVQADSATTRRYGGTGLGLAICRQLISLMGGTISVESMIGVGSTFTISLPLQKTAEPAPPPPDNTPKHNRLPRPLRVLVAEDNPINLLVTLRFLDRLGYQADVANNGMQAVEAVRQRPYDVVLMDLEMPDLDGMQATQRIRALGEAVHQPYIIALTAHDVTNQRDHYLQAGMNDSLSKPMQLDSLRQALLGVTIAPPS